MDLLGLEISYNSDRYAGLTWRLVTPLGPSLQLYPWKSIALCCSKLIGGPTSETWCLPGSTGQTPEKADLSEERVSLSESQLSCRLLDCQSRQGRHLNATSLLPLCPQQHESLGAGSCFDWFGRRHGKLCDCIVTVRPPRTMLIH